MEETMASFTNTESPPSTITSPYSDVATNNSFDTGGATTAHDDIADENGDGNGNNVAAGDEDGDISDTYATVLESTINPDANPCGPLTSSNSNMTHYGEATSNSTDAGGATTAHDDIADRIYDNNIATNCVIDKDIDISIMKAAVLKTCKEIPNTKPKIYQVPLTESIVDEERGLRKIEIGTNVISSTKTILLVGATGSGKSTLINALVNYILQVNWDDDFRFRLVDEPKEANQTKSQTKLITAYTLHHQNSFIIPYSLTIVDTPGFADTLGIERDKEICAQLEALFKSEGPVGLDSLDAVGFVVKSPDVRLTPTQRYIYDSVLGLFAKNIENNIYMLITFSDGNKPPVLDAIKVAKIPHKGYVKINNSVLYSDNQTGGDNVIFDQMYWTMGENSYQMFMVALQNMETRSLTLSREVLMERHRLERYIEAIDRTMYLAIQTSKQLIVEKEALSKIEQEAKDCQNFSYDIEQVVSEKRKLLPGESVTNCLRCQTTCCYPCYIKVDVLGLKYLCSAMTWGANCKYCPGNCPTSEHTADNFRFVLKKVKVTRTLDEIRQRYEQAGVIKMTAKELVQKVEEELEAFQIHISLLSDNIKKSLDQLRQIALKPNILSTFDYIDILIEKEKREGGPYNGAIKILQAAKKMHSRLVNLSRTKSNLTVDELSKIFEQTKSDLRKSGHIDQVAIISAAAKVKRFIEVNNDYS